MIYYNIHTHKKETKDNQVSIYNLSPEDIFSGVNTLTKNVYYSAGIHPWNAVDPKVDISLLREVLKNDRVVAIGEIGLDKLCDASMDAQINIFREQIELAKEYNLPIIIHCVRAWDELLTLYRESNSSKPWIIHGFRGGAEQAKQLQKFGFWFSLGEYYNKEALSAINPNSLLIETDESSQDIENIYENISEDIHCEVRELQQQMKQNVSRVFNL